MEAGGQQQQLHARADEPWPNRRAWRLLQRRRRARAHQHAAPPACCLDVPPPGRAADPCCWPSFPTRRCGPTALAH
ncbi:hypothetical protein GQ55_3G355700 [Panicum hallii var. hallii]|uniref:Uncharacterized protein n=1 Tax=Panicum hallii var. hallii TaxID=1504633 RepID=A0A2T7EFY4_9POAL|nr:hypothetical protein GQ55_3G355700 [Panicum hallii var. hallii]